MTKSQKFKSAEATEDLISQLPFEILHKILSQINSPKQAAKCITLSNRWRTVWRSYPVLEYNQSESRRRDNLAKFAEASMVKFSRDDELAIHTVDVTIRCLREQTANRSPVLEQLLELSSERKANLVRINVGGGRMFLPCSLISNSCTETLRLSSVCLSYSGDDLLALNSLRTLAMDNVHFDSENERIFTGLIASCPKLENLKIQNINLTNLQVSNVPNLKKLDIDAAWWPRRIEIEAPVLRTLNVRHANEVTDLVLVAPRLEHLEIREANLPGRNLQDAISKLPSLKSLALSGFHQSGKNLMLNLSGSPNLEQVKLWTPDELDSIRLDAGPVLSRFCLVGISDSIGDFPYRLEKCEINNAHDACRWEVDFDFTTDDETQELMNVGLAKSFIARFPKFQTLNITILDEPKVIFKEEEIKDESMHPTIIRHLKLSTDLCLQRDQEAILEAVFSICRPKFFTIIPVALGSKAKVLFDNVSKLMMPNKRHSLKKHEWRDQLKDVKITTRDVDRRGDGEEEEELIHVSTDMTTLLSTEKQVSFVLTWQ